jgi:demethylmenaquinone methyltransferase/2-methoxy-6-polyprenyl-1,4-benzoquinol methylase
METYEKDNADSIKALFNSIAKPYDFVNSVMSLNMHKHWNRQLVELAVVPHHPKTYLDLCCGTGAIAYSYLAQTHQHPTVYMLDFSQEMLAYAKARAAQLSLPLANLHYLEADAQNIPLPNASITCVTVAYGIRNITSPEKCIKDVYRVLEPGGTFGILELTVPKNKLVGLGHRLYLRTILPLIGKLFTSNKEAYHYLGKSINNFIEPQKLKTFLHNAGFKNIKLHSFCCGSATITIAQKPVVSSL